MHTKILILGGGLTGLSIAYHLEKFGQTDYLVAERESAPGGLCGSIQKNGFTFDYAGHLLHMHTPLREKTGKKIIENQPAPPKTKGIDLYKQITSSFPFSSQFICPSRPSKKRMCSGISGSLNGPQKRTEKF